MQETMPINNFNFNLRDNNPNIQSFTGYIKDGDFFNYANQQVGVSMKKYTDTLNTLNDAMEKLYQHNIIERPKTPEEREKELQLKIDNLTIQMNDMMKLINKQNEKQLEMGIENKE